MNYLIALALKYRKITLLFAVAVVVYGFISYQFIPKQDVPEFPFPAAIVMTVYPGASPTEVEELVTKKIEDAVSDIDGLDRMKSYSRNSVSIVVVVLEAEVESTDKPWQQLRQKVADVESDLPDQCEKPDINTNLGETAGVLVALSGEGYTYDQLVGFGEEFTSELTRIDGISRVEIVGEVAREVRIEIDAERLLLYHLSMEEVYNAVRMQNVEIPSGYLEKDGIKLKVNTPGTFESLKDIENTIVNVSHETGAVVRLKDFATVGFAAERGATRIKQNGQNAVLLAGYFKKDKNIVLIGKDVRGMLEKVKARLPDRLHIDEVLFQPEDVDRSVSSFMSSLLQGVIMVILVVFLGMGLRNAIVVSTAIPFSVMVTIASMSVLGIAIHQTSTMALIIALGMLVDNAIVIADAVQVRMDRGLGKLAAALDGAKDSAIPVFSATLTTVAAYAPLLFLPGSAGKFAEALPMVVIIALSASYAVAILVTPTLATLFFKPLEQTRQRKPIVRQVFHYLLSMGLQHRGRAIAIALLAFAGAIWLRGQMGLSFFPHAAKEFAHIAIYSEQADLDRTEKVALEVDRILRSVPEITDTTISIGEGLPKFYFTVGKSSQKDDYAQILFHFNLDKGQRFEKTDDLIFYIQSLLDRQIAGATASVRQLEIQGDSESPIGIRVSGQNLDRIHEVAKALKGKISDMAGIYDVTDDSAHRVLQLMVDVDDDVATSAGLSKYDILRQINIALYGSKASVYRNSGKEYDIVVTSNIDTRAKLENLGIKSRFAPTWRLLKQVASTRLEPHLEIIQRFNRERSVAVTAKAAPGYSAAALEDLIEQETLSEVNTDGVSLVFDGERERIKRLFGSVFIAALVAVAVVYIILFVQFNSFLRPIVILLTVPLSAVGAILGLFLFRQDFSFTAVLGMASLVGIVVNNAILLIDYIDKARAEGATVDEACLDAFSKRYRPIMLSTITTALGLTPLLLKYNPLFTPMAISLMMGLLISTFLTLIIIPVTFSLAFSWEDRKLGRVG